MERLVLKRIRRRARAVSIEPPKSLKCLKSSKARRASSRPEKKIQTNPTSFLDPDQLPPEASLKLVQYSTVNLQGLKSVPNSVPTARLQALNPSSPHLRTFCWLLACLELHSSSPSSRHSRPITKTQSSVASSSLQQSSAQASTLQHLLLEQTPVRLCLLTLHPHVDIRLYLQPPEPGTGQSRAVASYPVKQLATRLCCCVKRLLALCTEYV